MVVGFTIAWPAFFFRFDDLAVGRPIETASEHLLATYLPLSVLLVVRKWLILLARASCVSRIGSPCS